MRLILLTLFLFSYSLTFAQAPDACGTSVEAQYFQREKMFQNRLRIDQTEIERLQNQRFTIYIPTVIHIVGDSAGNAVADPDGALGMMCRLNEDFADQNIQFYIKDSIRYFYDNIVNADAYDSVSIDRMILAKDTLALNIFINGAAGGGVAGYYSRRGDFVFILSPYAVYSSTTITHELGHFFTLPHTFFGWEGQNAPSMYSNTPAPDTVETSRGTRVEVEYVARSGANANCFSSADGFCDTEADYYSFRLNCPTGFQAQDPSGTVIAPDDRLYMSYFFDNCMDSFSSEQKIAMMADVIDRGWTAFPPPPSVAPITGTNIAAVSPAEASTVAGNPTDLVRLEWDTTGAFHADKWIVEIGRMFNGIPVGTILVEIVKGQNYLEVPFSLFGSNRDFRWRVLPYSNGYFCAQKSAYFSFSTGTILGLEQEQEALMQLKIQPNPVQNKVLNLSIQSFENTEAQISIYAFDGRLILNQNSWIDAGQTDWQIALNNIASGVYQIVIQTPQKLYQERFIIQD
jgi:hypothetical protein